MRINDQEIYSIKQSVISLDKDAKVYAFGSRTDDSLKGGDIDLLIISDKLDSFEDKSRIRWKIIEQIGEQKIDIIIVNNPDANSFVKNIFVNAVKL